MRTYEEYHQILTLWEKCGNKKQISRITGISRTTIRECIKKFGSVQGLEQSELHNVTIKGEPLLLRQLKANDDDLAHVRDAYAYIFGMYLGDGYISTSKGHRAQRLRISLDMKYQGIIDACVHNLKILFPDNQVGIVDCVGCVNVSLYHKHLHQIFPQHGKGTKHERRIILKPWQQSIVDKYALAFFKGLYHSDGTRSVNWVKGKNYPRYMFSNVSDDIRKLFTDSAEKLGLHWTTANARNVAISRREDVAWLDERIGEKA